MRHFGILVSIFMITLSTAPAFADDYPTYVGRKLARGLTNTAFGWTEILKSEERAFDEHGAMSGIFWGPLDGIGNAIKRTAVGIYETATFPIKTSKNADPILKPEFVGPDKDDDDYRPKEYAY